MTSNELLTQVGPGTPMGALMREYWAPACLASELNPDGAPLRLVLFGERLIAFRTGSGEIGVLDHRCPHRGVSLFLGRNEKEGIRCVYHGWKYDVAGQCVDMANVPASRDFKRKVRAKAYPARERNGLVWVYMGGRKKPPELPLLAPNLIPAEDATIFLVQRNCNWLQALEGDIDTSHFGFLHAGLLAAEDLDEDDPIRQFYLDNRSPEYEVSHTDWGVMSGAKSPASNGQISWRVAQFVFPYWTLPPAGGRLGDTVTARAWVPLDDEHTMFVHLSRTEDMKKIRFAPSQTRDGRPVSGLNMRMKLLPNSSDWFGRFRMEANQANDWEIDRAVQQNESFTGIDGIHLQDQAVTESMGPIVDRDLEHLAETDKMVIQVRKSLSQAARALTEKGEVPASVDNPALFLRARAGQIALPADADWESIYHREAESFGSQYL